MGNAALRELAVIESVPADTITGETIGIDAHNWLYRYLTIVVRFTAEETYRTDDGTEVPNLIGLLQGLPRLLEYDVTPVFVFDGAPSQLKADELADRRAQREQREMELAAARERGDEVEIARLESQTQQLTPVIQETSRELLNILDIPVVDAPAEGEAQAAAMARNGAVDAVGTEDYDALLFGAPMTYRDLTSSGGIERMDFQATLNRHGLTHGQLVDVALLCGTDFNDGITGFGPKTAVEAVSEYGSLPAVLDANDAVMPQADRLRELFLEPAVDDEYSIDATITPDLEGARTYVTETWSVPEAAIESELDRLEAATTQTGLDRWT